MRSRDGADERPAVSGWIEGTWVKREYLFDMAQCRGNHGYAKNGKTCEELKKNERSKNKGGGTEAVILAPDDALKFGMRHWFAARTWAAPIRCGRTIGLGWDWTSVQVTAGISAEFAALTACDGQHTLN
jgi:hypothetical protein